MARSGYREFLKDGTDEGEERWENIQERKTVARNYDNMPGGESLSSFLEEVALVSDVDGLKDSEQGPALLTLHMAKGLEFPVVFMIGMEDGIFPHSRSREDPEQMEEERRLAYVGVTRAKDQLYLINAFRRTLYGRDELARPSPFLEDIPIDLVEVRSSTGQQVNTPRSASGRSWEEKTVYRSNAYQAQTRWETATPAHRAAARRAAANKPETQFKTGESVNHKTFGQGTVILVQVQDDEELVTVAFPGKGVKKLIASFAQLEKL
jgi:DNA helicase-2/ATP-dependent DNA helicase PcrA